MSTETAADPREDKLIQYLHRPGLIVAWIGEGDPLALGRQQRPPRNLILATATRFTKRHGSAVSGWIVATDHEHGDVLPRRSAALASLRAVAERELPLYADAFVAKGD